MSVFGKVTPHIFINNVTASFVSPWYPVDSIYGMHNERSISGTKVSAAGSEVVLELRTLVMARNAQGVNVTAADVIATATAWTSAITNFAAVVVGPFTHIRARRVGASAAATVVGMV